jgi:hypothetical protein
VAVVPIGAEGIARQTGAERALAASANRLLAAERCIQATLFEKMVTSNFRPCTFEH